MVQNPFKSRCFFIVDAFGLIILKILGIINIKNKELCLKNKLKAGYHSYFRYQSVYEIRKTSDIALNINAKKQEISQRRVKIAKTNISSLNKIEKKKKKEGSKKNNILLAVFILLGVLGVCLTWKNIWCIFSMISVILSTVAYWQTKTERMKLLLFAVTVSQLIYAIRFASYAAIANEVLSMLSLLIYFIRTRLHVRSKSRSEDLSEKGK